MKYTIETAMEKLSRKRVRFNKNEIDTSKADYLGIKSLGIIDYLVNYHKFTWRRYA